MATRKVATYTITVSINEDDFNAMEPELKALGIEGDPCRAVIEKALADGPDVETIHTQVKYEEFGHTVGRTTDYVISTITDPPK